MGFILIEKTRMVKVSTPYCRLKNCIGGSAIEINIRKDFLSEILLKEDSRVYALYDEDNLMRWMITEDKGKSGNSRKIQSQNAYSIIIRFRVPNLIVEDLKGKSKRYDLKYELDDKGNIIFEVVR